jgi:hypothetical protein
MDWNSIKSMSAAMTVEEKRDMGLTVQITLIDLCGDVSVLSRRIHLRRS